MFASVTPDTMKFTYLPTHPPQNPTTLNHLLYFFAFGKKEEMEKMVLRYLVVDYQQLYYIGLGLD